MEPQGEQASESFWASLANLRPWLVVLARLHLDRRSAAHEASDIAQEVLIDVMKYESHIAHLPSVELERWLRRVLRNKVIDFYRKRRPEISIADRERIEADVADSFIRLEEMLVDSATTPSRHASLREDLLRLASAIEELPSEYREVVLLRDLAGQSLTEVAQQLDCSIGVVAGRVRRARGLLHQWLKNGTEHE